MKRILNCKIDGSKEQFIEELTQEINNFNSFFTTFDLKVQENGFTIIARENTKGIGFIILTGKIIESSSDLNISIDLQTSVFVKGVFIFIAITEFSFLLSMKDIKSLEGLVFVFLFFIVAYLYIYYPQSRNAKKLIKRIFQKHDRVWQEVRDDHKNPTLKSNFLQISIIFICICLISFFGFRFIKDIRFILSREMAKERQISEQQGKIRVPDISGLEGGYAPKNELRVGNYKILGLVLESGKDASFFVQNINGSKYREVGRCLYYRLESGIIKLREIGPCGEISFNGIFLPVNGGNYWIVPENTIVLKGKLQVVKDNKIVYFSENQEFKFHIYVTN